MTICPMCKKGELFVPDGVVSRIDLHCTKCGEIYIPGTRVEHTTNVIREMLEDLEGGVYFSRKKYITEEDMKDEPIR